MVLIVWEIRLIENLLMKKINLVTEHIKLDGFIGSHKEISVHIPFCLHIKLK